MGNWHTGSGLKLAKRLLAAIGIDPRQFSALITGVPWYVRSHVVFRRLCREASVRERIEFYPVFRDRAEQAGVARGHYFHQDLLVAQWIWSSNPNRHVDFGSRVDGFVAHLAAFRQVEYADIRPLDAPVRNIKSVRVNMMGADLSNIGTSDSVSSLHVIEHIGLGRYGDSLDPRGHEKAISNLSNVVADGGRLYVSVPVGRPRIEYNAHRVFDPVDFVSLFSGKFVLKKCGLVDDRGDLHCHEESDRHDGPPFEDKLYEAKSWNYGCGIYCFEKSTS